MEKAEKKPKAGTLRVLILEDDPSDAELIQRALRRDGILFSARVTKNRRDFSAALARFLPQLILSDFKLPGFDGMAALALARARAPEIPFIFVSGSIGEEKAITSLSLGAADYIFKDNLTRLGPTVKRVLAEAETRQQKAKAEKSLRESERMLSTLVANLPGFVYRCRNDRSWTMEYISEGCREITGYGPEDFIAGRKLVFADIIRADFKQPIWKEWQRRLKRREPFEFEYAIRGATGEERWVWERGRGVFAANGKLLFLEGFITDITKNRHQEQALRESEEKYRILVETSPDAIITIDGGGRITFTSQKALDLFAVPGGSDVLGASVLDFVDPADASRVQERMIEILSGSKIPEIRDYRLRRRDKEPFWAEVISAPLRDSAGRHIGLLLVCRDVSERRRIETALRESEVKYRLIAENTVETISLLDLNLRFTYISPSIFKLRGFTAEESLSQDLRQVMTPEALARIQQAFSEEMALEASGGADPKRSRTMELEEYRKDGSIIWVENSISFMRDPQGNAISFLVVSKDISERKRAEREQTKLLDIIEKSLNEIYVFDSITLKFEYVNQGALRNIGYNLDEMKKRTPVDIKPLYTEAAFRDLIRPLIRLEKEKLVFTSLHRRKDGSDYPVEIHLQLFQQDNKSVFLAFINDITERIRAEEQIAYQANLLQEVSDAIIATNEDDRIQMWNKAAERIYGWKADEAIGRIFRDLIQPEYSFQRREEVMEILGRVGAWSGELVHNIRYGQRIPVQSSITRLKDSAGRPAGTVSINHDISERKQAEIALRHSEEKFRKIFEEHSAVKLLLDPVSGAIIDANQAAEKFYGWTREELKRMTIGQINTLPPEKLLSELKRTREEGRVYFQFRHRLADGSVRDVEVFSSRIQIAGSDFLHSIIHDISERKRAEEMIQSSLREKEVLLQEIHHRVKNNLQIVSGLLTLQAGHAATKSVEEMFRESQDRIRSIALVHESLYRSHNLAEIAFDEYLRVLVGNLVISHFAAAGRVAVQFDMERIQLTIETAIPLGLIVNELVTNSLKHAFPGDRRGEIRISLRERRGVKFYAPTDENLVPIYELTVADDGIGLPAGFELAEQKTLGTQILSMLVKQLKGELTLRGGPGTEWHFTIPAQPRKAKAHEAKS